MFHTSVVAVAVPECIPVLTPPPGGVVPGEAADGPPLVGLRFREGVPGASAVPAPRPASVDAPVAGPAMPVSGPPVALIGVPHHHPGVRVLTQAVESRGKVWEPCRYLGVGKPGNLVPSVPMWKEVRWVPSSWKWVNHGCHSSSRRRCGRCLLWWCRRRLLAAVCWWRSVDRCLRIGLTHSGRGSGAAGGAAVTLGSWRWPLRLWRHCCGRFGSRGPSACGGRWTAIAL